jgi:flagellar hook-basal body complex protein FliE
MSSISGIGSGSSGLSGAAGLREIMDLRRQIIDKSQVLQQVHAPQGQIAAASGSDLPNANGAQGFTSALGDAVGHVNASQTRADQMTAAYETGQTQDVAKVMLARQEASVGFEATLQVRNKLLSAYQDIMKMGV